jgi:guanosine-3',5'-bis(diphosphate) 3'-pyrophosphohydrolase
MELSADGLIAKIRAYNPEADLDMVRLAFEFAEQAHRGQLRASGEPYISHPLAAAHTLADMRMPPSLVIAALLHDVPEDTAVTVEDVAKDFGSDVAGIVSGITKLGKIKYRGIDRYVENLRKMFLAMASDVRVVLVKFADRIHNLETLDSLPEEKRRRVALESLEIYAPIANRLGMNEFKVRLEDQSFKCLMPEEHAWVSGLAARAITEKKDYAGKVEALLTDGLKAAGVSTFEVHGRVKHLYSLYKKLQKYDRDIVRIHDLIALRVIVDDIGDCYAALGVIHQKWKPLKGRIKDYIAQPKPNGYQSLHTTVFCEGGEIVEFQIRTRKMHDEAERGIAAHWKYDEDGKRSSAAVSKQLAWVAELAAADDEEDAKRFMESLESLKIDVFQDRIFVFTPKGDVIDLPEGATPVDFAYAIHTGIGNTCVGARVNDILVGLDSKLSSGDCCEIVTDKNRKGPSADWLTFAKTAHARDRIRGMQKATAEWRRGLDATGEQPKKQRTAKVR